MRNKGEKQMYYIHHDHVAIVSEELWEKAQERLAEPRERKRNGSPGKITVKKNTAIKNMSEQPIVRKEKQNDLEQNEFAHRTPPLTLVNYPYKDRIFCKYCGSRLRRIIARNRSVWWICNGCSRKGKSFCKGIRVPDEKLYSLRNISISAYIGKEFIDGKETYGYSTEPDQCKC